MDRVFIEGLEVEALIGIYDWERRIRQPLLFDIEMAFDNRKPAASDAIADTLDYKAVSKRLVAFVSASSFGLVETLAERCAEIVLREFGVESLKLKLSKPGAVRGARAVGVTIERDRASLAQAKPLARPEPATAAISKPEPATPPPQPASATATTTARRESVALAFARAGSAPSAVQLAAARVLARRDQPPAAAPAAPLPVPVAAPRREDPKAHPHAQRAPTVTTYISLGSNIEPERNLRSAVAALRERFGEVQLSPVYRTRAVGFEGPDFLNAIAAIESDVHPFALNDWLHALEIAHGRDRRDKSYSDRPIDLDIIYFGKLVLEGPGDFMLPRPELRHAFVLKPLADIAPRFVDPVRGATLETLWKSHPDHDDPPQPVALEL
jgi:2-amino-4-hydroxy-6-hydroxymethyldihydropteridine diphosphokinase